MRILNKKRWSNSDSGNVLVMTLVITGIIGFSLASYLTLVKSQNLATMRSQAWNASIPVIEAGIEDGLAHLNAHGASGILATDGWLQSGNVYYIKRALADSYYIVTISNYVGPTSLAPVVESRGYVKMPTQVASHSSWVLAQVAEPAKPATMARGVRVVAGRNSLFAKGLVAKGKIDLNGRDITTDSFNSTLDAYSTDGLYDINKRRANGDVATNSGLINSLEVGNADIYGKVSTGPGGTTTIGPTGSVGDLDWHLANKKGIQSGYFANDMNVDFKDVEEPKDAFIDATGMSGTDGTTSYDYVLPTGSWKLDSLTMKDSQQMLITGDVTLYVSDKINLTGLASITIAEGASLKLYMAGSDTYLGGNAIINKSGNATNFLYYGLPSNNKLTFAGNGTFTGVIYAPEADFSMSGSGVDYHDFIGASITKTVTMFGRFKFHYDEALANYGNDGKYFVASWNEMGPAEVKNMLNLYFPALN